MSTTAFHFSNGRSSSGMPGAPTPALLNSTSRRPKVSLVLANSALTEAGSVTSVGTASALRPRPFTCSATASSGSLRRPLSATSNPSLASASDDALPIPEPAPVTSATLAMRPPSLAAWRPFHSGFGALCLWSGDPLIRCKIRLRGAAGRRMISARPTRIGTLRTRLSIGNASATNRRISCQSRL